METLSIKFVDEEILLSNEIDKIRNSDNMIQSNLQRVNFVVANTDAQALEKSLCD